MKDFYNTISLEGEDLKEAAANGCKQAEVILDFFKANPDKECTPPEVHKALFGDNVPITSTRRAMSDLSKEFPGEPDPELKKTDNQREGEYGKPNYCWKLRVANSPVKPLSSSRSLSEVEGGGIRKQSASREAVPVQGDLFS